MAGKSLTKNCGNYRILQHCVFRTYGRKPVLVDVIWSRAQELIRQISAEKGYEVVCHAVMPDHVHLLLRIQPSETSQAMNMFKGVMSRRIFQEFPDLRVDMQSDHFWAAGYYSRAIPPENVSTAIRYINSQGQHPDEL